MRIILNKKDVTHTHQSFIRIINNTLYFRMRKILQKYFIKRTIVILNRHCGKYHNDFKYLRFLNSNIQCLTPTLVLQIKAHDYLTT